MQTHLLSLVALMAAFITSGLTAAQAQPVQPTVPPQSRGLRTDRLSAKQLERWTAIVRLVFAEDDLGRPLHPTLRGMWDQVVASSHEVYVELPEPRRSVSCMAGLFLIERVDPDGHIVAVVRLNLKTIDRADVKRGTAHTGFLPFHGLEGVGRYAEVLGHELAHAVWALGDPTRARRALELQSRQLRLARSLPTAGSNERVEIRRRLREVDAEVEALEIPARAAEARVWEELVASQAARGVQKASSRRGSRNRG